MTEPEVSAFIIEQLAIPGNTLQQVKDSCDRFWGPKKVSPNDVTDIKSKFHKEIVKKKRDYIENVEDIPFATRKARIEQLKRICDLAMIPRLITRKDGSIEEVLELPAAIRALEAIRHEMFEWTKIQLLERRLEIDQDHRTTNSYTPLLEDRQMPTITIVDGLDNGQG